MAKLTKISGDEFVKKILSGERDFKRIRLSNFNLSDHESVEALQTYLDGQNLQESPLILSESHLSGLTAYDISLPYLEAARCNFEGGNFGESNLTGANFGHSYFKGAIFCNADLESVYLRHADLEHVKMEGARLRCADLRDVKNLKKTEGLKQAIFEHTVVNSSEKKIILDVLGINDLFDVREA